MLTNVALAMSTKVAIGHQAVLAPGHCGTGRGSQIPSSGGRLVTAVLDYLVAAAGFRPQRLAAVPRALVFMALIAGVFAAVDLAGPGNWKLGVGHWIFLLDPKRCCSPRTPNVRIPSLEYFKI
jgi:hypothetical protein